jgi:hypothetical protein
MAPRLYKLLETRGVSVVDFYFCGNGRDHGPDPLPCAIMGHLEGATMKFCAVVVCAVSTAYAATIVSVGGVPDFAAATGQQQAVTAGFTTGQDYSNVSISAELGGITTQNVTAYLTTQIGPGTTAAMHEIATTTIGLPGLGPVLTPIFTGLSLGAGTYYLTLFHPTDTGGSWYTSDAAVITTAAGSSHDFDGRYITNFPMVVLPAYAPAATFSELMTFDDPPQNRDLLYVVETVAIIPEPSTAVLAAAALAALAILRRRSA